MSSSLTTTADPAAIAALSGPPSISRFEEAVIRAQDPDLHLALDAGNDTCRARCSVWWTEAPSREGDADVPIGCVGHYAAADDAAAAQVLDAALDRLRDAGCTRAVGPMDGATWFPYRFVTDRGDRPPFLMEPWHPPAYPDQFETAGFSPVETYASALVPELPEEPPGDPPVDVTTRPIDLSDDDRARAELRRVYDLVVRAFAANPYYTPIAEPAFLALYRNLLSAVDPPLARLAETPEGDLAGLVFCLPDHLQAERGETVDTVIVKTLAVDPEHAGQGLGGWLTAEVQHVARRRGYTRAVHALMHESNRSQKISRHYGAPFRRYALFERELQTSGGSVGGTRLKVSPLDATPSLFTLNLLP
jgi:GNAT superfamily N-acetyltransferase